MGKRQEQLTFMKKALKDKTEPIFNINDTKLITDYMNQKLSKFDNTDETKVIFNFQEVILIHTDNISNLITESVFGIYISKSQYKVIWFSGNTFIEKSYNNNSDKLFTDSLLKLIQIVKYELTTKHIYEAKLDDYQTLTNIKEAEDYLDYLEYQHEELKRKIDTYHEWNNNNNQCVPILK